MTHEVVADFRTSVCFCVQLYQCQACTKVGLRPDLRAEHNYHSRLISVQDYGAN